MKEAVVIFKHNRTIIENFLRSTIELNELDEINKENSKIVFKLLSSLELSYMVDNDYKQITPYFFKDKINTTTYGLSKGQLFSKINIESDTIFISNPYISSHTGNMCITAAKSVENGFIIFDFNLINVLKSLSLIELNKPFNALSKLMYGAIGSFLFLMAIVLLGYAVKIIIESVFMGGFFKEIGSIFTPIIAITLALAIYDLAKTILEREVFYKNYTELDDAEDKVLRKFLTSIIIALSIEALMVVFKVTLSDDFSQMTYALYLILGIASLIISMGVYRRFVTNLKND